MKITSLLASLSLAALASGAQAAPGSGPGPRPSAIPVGRYTDFALSKDARSFSPQNPRYAQLGGMPPTARGLGAGYVELSCASSQTVLRAPMGWLGDEDGQNSTLFTPDQRTRVIMGFRDLGAGADAFAQLKKTLRASTQEQMKAAGQKVARVRTFALPGGSYALEITNVTTQSGAKNGMLQVYTPNPQRPRYPMSLSLTSSMSRFRRDQGLAGLILRDRKIIWST